MRSDNKNGLSRRGLIKALGGLGAMALFSSCSTKFFDSPIVNGQSSGIEYLDSVDFLRLLNRPLEQNVLKLFRAVADPIRNRVYVAGILTRHIGILDGNTEEWIGTVDSGIVGVNQKYLAIDSEANRLYVLDNSAHTLRAIELEIGQITGPIAMPDSLGNLLADTKRGLLYFVSRERPSFRAFDGSTLELAYSIDEMGDGVSQMALDEANDVLYLLDGAKTGPDGRIFRLDLETREVTKTISFDMPPNLRANGIAFDESQERLIVMIPNRMLLVLDTDGNELNSIPMPRELEYQQMLYDSENQRVYVAFIELPDGGQVAGIDGRVQIYDINDGQLLSDLSFGRKIHSMARNATTGKVYLPNGDASIVWSIAPDGESVTPLRLGDSLEQVIYSSATGALYLNSRLGANYLLDYDPNSSSVETFTDGVWPIPIRTDSTGEHLFVLNAWNSTLSVYELLPDRRLLATIPIGLPAGSTDRLPDLAIDSSRKRAYTAYPEFGKIAVVDWDAMTALQIITIDDFKTGDTGGGPGDLQVIVNESAGRLFAYSKAERILSIFDVENGHALINKINLARSRDDSTGSNANLLYLDADRGRLFVGSEEYDSVSGAPTGRQIARGQRLFAYDELLNVYWANAIETQGAQSDAVLVAVNAETLAEQDALVLGTSDVIPPEYAFDPLTRTIYVAYMISVRVDSYRV